MSYSKPREKSMGLELYEAMLPLFSVQDSEWGQMTRWVSYSELENAARDNPQSDLVAWVDKDSHWLGYNRIQKMLDGNGFKLNAGQSKRVILRDSGGPENHKFAWFYHIADEIECHIREAGGSLYGDPRRIGDKEWRNATAKIPKIRKILDGYSSLQKEKKNLLSSAGGLDGMSKEELDSYYALDGLLFHIKSGITKHRLIANSGYTNRGEILPPADVGGVVLSLNDNFNDLVESHKKRAANAVRAAIEFHNRRDMHPNLSIAKEVRLVSSEFDVSEFDLNNFRLLGERSYVFWDSFMNYGFTARDVGRFCSSRKNIKDIKDSDLLMEMSDIRASKIAALADELASCGVEANSLIGIDEICKYDKSSKSNKKKIITAESPIIRELESENISLRKQLFEATSKQESTLRLLELAKRDRDISQKNLDLMRGESGGDSLPIEALKGESSISELVCEEDGLAPFVAVCGLLGLKRAQATLFLKRMGLKTGKQYLTSGDKTSTFYVTSGGVDLLDLFALGLKRREVESGDSRDVA